MRNPAPDLQSLKRHGSLLWSCLSGDLDAAKDAVSPLGRLRDSKFEIHRFCFILSGRTYLRMASSNIKGTKQTLLVGEHTSCIHWYTSSIQKHGALSTGWEYSTSKSILVLHTELYRQPSEPEEKADLRSQRPTSEFNQEIPWKVRVYFDTTEISFKRSKARGKDHWLHSPACTLPGHHSRSRKQTFFITVSSTSKKMTLTANFVLHRQSTKGLCGLIDC